MEVRKGGKKGNARGEKAARFGVLRKEGGNDTNRGDRVREDRRRGYRVSAVQENRGIVV